MVTSKAEFMCRVSILSFFVCGSLQIATAIAQDPGSFAALQVNVQSILDAEGDAGVGAAAQATADWIAGTGDSGLQTLSEDQLAWLLKTITWSAKDVDSGFAVTWTGQLQPPQTGSFTFSISPIDITTKYQDELVLQWMTVVVNGQEVVNASPDDWRFEGAQIELSAGEVVPLEINYRYETAEAQYGSGKPPAQFFTGRVRALARGLCLTAHYCLPMEQAAACWPNIDV